MTTDRSVLPQVGSSKKSYGLTLIAALVMALSSANVLAQEPPAPGSSMSAPAAETLEILIGRIALYPDDLIAIILPASTNPIQLVQADRFLDKRKTDPKLPIDDKWDDSVKTLLNYPEVVRTMSNDLDWTTALGEAVVTDQGAVLEAIQTFRRKTQAVGNLKSDDKQVVMVEKEVITIVPADPQVIYVPQYNPSTVVVHGGYSSWGYYPAPYPVYYYPYAPGAALATGLIWGAAIGAIWNGGHYATHYGHGGNNNININRNTNINTGNINTGNINRPGAPSQRPVGAGGGSSQWKPNKQPGQVGRTPSTRPGDASRTPSTRPGNSGSMGARPSTQPSGGGGGAFSGNVSGRQTQMDSARGASSRNATSGAGARQSPSANTRQAPSAARSSGGGGSRSGGGRSGGGRSGGGGGRR